MQAFIAYIFANEKAIAKRARFVPLDVGAAEAGADQLRSAARPRTARSLLAMEPMRAARKAAL